MQSQTRLASVVGRDGMRGSGAEKEVAVVEIDSQVARVVGLAEDMKVSRALWMKDIVMNRLMLGVGWRPITFGSANGTYCQH